MQLILLIDKFLRYYYNGAFCKLRPVGMLVHIFYHYVSICNMVFVE